MMGCLAAGVLVRPRGRLEPALPRLWLAPWE